MAIRSLAVAHEAVDLALAPLQDLHKLVNIGNIFENDAVLDELLVDTPDLLLVLDVLVQKAMDHVGCVGQGCSISK